MLYGPPLRPDVVAEADVLAQPVVVSSEQSRPCLLAELSSLVVNEILLNAMLLIGAILRTEAERKKEEIWAS